MCFQGCEKSDGFLSVRTDLRRTRVESARSYFWRGKGVGGWGPLLFYTEGVHH